MVIFKNYNWLCIKSLSFTVTFWLVLLGIFRDPLFCYTFTVTAQITITTLFNVSAWMLLLDSVKFRIVNKVQDTCVLLLELSVSVLSTSSSALDCWLHNDPVTSSLVVQCCHRCWKDTKKSTGFGKVSWTFLQLFNVLRLFQTNFIITQLAMFYLLLRFDHHRRPSSGTECSVVTAR